MKWMGSLCAGLTRIVSVLPGFSKPDKYSLHFLNFAQFMGVLNDNIFKLVIAYLLIAILGQNEASTIMAISGAVFVLPFLLFSSTAGVLADRFSKQRLMMLMKAVEMLLFLLAMVAFVCHSVWGSYTLLFLLATHSALFGPSKYAIIAELVPKDQVSSANGWITSFTYCGMILGTFLASFFTQITGRNFVLVALFCFCIALLGFIGTLGIRKTAAAKKHQPLNWLFITEIVRTLKFCSAQKHLLVAMSGSAYFLFLGAFVQLNIIPFAITSLHMTDIAGGYLFLCTAVGIAIGAFLGGKASRRRVELGLSSISAFFIALFLFIQTHCCHDLFTVIVVLVMLGVCGGLFIVPFDSFVQLHSPPERRGQIIGANNFLSFCGVLLASLALFIFSRILKLTPAQGFAMMGGITLGLAVLMMLRLSDLALPFLAKCLLRPWVNIITEGLELLDRRHRSTLILPQASWLRTLWLLSVLPPVHLIIKAPPQRYLTWLARLFYSIHLVPSDATYEPLVRKAEELLAHNIVPCILIKELNLPPVLTPSPTLLSMLRPPPLLYAHVTTHKIVLSPK